MSFFGYTDDPNRSRTIYGLVGPLLSALPDWELYDAIYKAYETAKRGECVDWDDQYNTFLMGALEDLRAALHRGLLLVEEPPKTRSFFFHCPQTDFDQQRDPPREVFLRVIREEAEKYGHTPTEHGQHLISMVNTIVRESSSVVAWSDDEWRPLVDFACRLHQEAPGLSVHLVLAAEFDLPDRLSYSLFSSLFGKSKK